MRTSVYKKQSPPPGLIVDEKRSNGKSWPAVKVYQGVFEKMPVGHKEIPPYPHHVKPFQLQEHGPGNHAIFNDGIIQKVDTEDEADDESEDKNNKEDGDDLKTIKKVAKKKISKSRHPTAFGEFSSMGKNLQGPHTQSFVSKELAYETGKELGHPLTELKDTYALLKPKQVNKLLKKVLEKRQNEPDIREKRHDFVNDYDKNYNKIGNLSDSEAEEKNIKKLIEKQPHGTYGLDTGKYTPDEIKGKGERKSNAIPDLYKMSKLKKGKDFGDNFPKDLKNFDGGGRLEDKILEASQKQASDISKFAFGESLSEASLSESSLSDINEEESFTDTDEDKIEEESSDTDKEDRIEEDE